MYAVRICTHVYMHTFVRWRDVYRETNNPKGVLSFSLPALLHYLIRPHFIIVIYYQFKAVERKILITYNLFLHLAKSPFSTCYLVYTFFLSSCVYTYCYLVVKFFITSRGKLNTQTDAFLLLFFHLLYCK